MKILIIAHARSGSTNLANAICNLTGDTLYFEPFNSQRSHREDNWLNSPPKDIPENCVVKTIIFQNKTWVRERAKDFDLVIFLSRANIREVFISAQNAYNKNNYHGIYINDAEPTDDMMRFVSIQYKMLTHMNMLLSKDSLVNSRFVWYEDIFCEEVEHSLSSIRNLGIDCSQEKFTNVWKKWLSPKKRLRII